jgi:hypothetical protein
VVALAPVQIKVQYELRTPKATHSGVWTLPPIQVYNLKWILDLMERATKTSHASFLVPKSASILAF